MDNKRKIALAVAAVAALGFGSLAWNNSSGQQAASTAEHGANDGHGDEKKAASAAKEEGDEGHGEEGHSEEGGEEEGKLTLSAEQIKAAGVALEAAAPRDLGTVVSFPGEIRFDEDRTAHVVPRVPALLRLSRPTWARRSRKGKSSR